MEFTGERVIPGKVNLDLLNEHLVRYTFAKQLVKPSYQILDAGCGVGYGTKELVIGKSNVKATGIDISHEAIHYAVEHYGTSGCYFNVMNLEELTLEKESFDLVVCFEVIEHLHQPEKFLSSIASLIKKDGFFVVSTPNKKMYSDAIPGYNNPYHVKEYYLDEFMEMLSGYFPNVDIYSQNYTQGMFIKPIQSEVSSCNISTNSSTESSMKDDNASYFVAVCSFEESAKISPVILTITQSNIIAEKDKYIEKLRKEVEIRDESVAVFKSNAIIQSEWQANLQDELVNRDRIIEAYNKEIKNLKEWIEVLNLEVRKRDDSVSTLMDANKSQNDWIVSLQNEVAKRDEATEFLINEINVKNDWIEKLQEEIRKRDESVMELVETIRVLSNGANAIANNKTDTD